MLKGKKKSQKGATEQPRVKDFFDCILPGNIKFFANYCIVGDTYRCVWVIREYPPTTEEQAILAQLADRTGVTLHLYHRRVTPMEERQIVNNAARKNRLMAGDHDITQAMEAEGNLQDVQTLLATIHLRTQTLCCGGSKSPEYPGWEQSLPGGSQLECGRCEVGSGGVLGQRQILPGL